jgi:hypothetical protein
MGTEHSAGGDAFELASLTETEQFYSNVLRDLLEAGLPFMVGGGYAVNLYADARCPTKDQDIFTTPAETGQGPVRAERGAVRALRRSWMLWKGAERLVMASRRRPGLRSGRTRICAIEAKTENEQACDEQQHREKEGKIVVEPVLPLANQPDHAETNGEAADEL